MICPLRAGLGRPCRSLQATCCCHPPHPPQQASNRIGMSAAAAAAGAAFVAHPVACAAEQARWESALARPGAEATPSAAAAAAAAVLHPAVACQAEADAWEQALGGRPRPQQPQLLCAVVECGSHSTRLLLSCSRRGELARLTRDTHLGGSSSPAAPGEPRAISRAAADTLEAVAAYRQRIEAEQQQQQAPVRCVVAAVATAAVREAADGPQVAARISAALGQPLRVLTGQEEAELAFIGSTGSLNLQSTAAPCLVIDLGGRSTELAAGFAGSRPLAVATIPLGCFQLQQQQQRQPQQQSQQQSQDAAQAILAAHRSAVDSVVHALQHHRQQQQPLTVVATGGTVTTLAALHLGLKDYDSRAVHGSELRRSDVAALAQALQQQQAQERPAWVSDARVETLLPGCCALLALLDVLVGGAGGGAVEQWCVTVSDRDLLDGVLVALQLEAAAGVLT